MSKDHHTYRVTWSQEDGEYLGLCVEFPSLSWLAATPEDALSGIRAVTPDAISDMQSNGETVPKRSPKRLTAVSFEYGFLLL